MFTGNIAFSQVENVHLSWDGENKRMTQTTLTVTWSNVIPYNGKIRYGIKQTELNQTSKPVKKNYSKELGTNVYTAQLQNLQPNTKYFYQCGSENGEWSEVFSFSTAPPLGNREKFVVGIWGDTQNNGENKKFEVTKVIIEKMIKNQMNFTIHMGDIVENGSIVESWKDFFKTTQPLNSLHPFMPVTGNHDVCNDANNQIFQEPFPVFHDLFNLPKNNTDYSFDYGNAHFVALSSGHAKGVEEAGNSNYRYSIDSPEYRWLEKDLKRASKNKKIDWIIVYMHHPLISYGWSHVKGWQERIMPLINKYKIDLALAGHRHVYERHKAMQEMKILDQENFNLYDKPNGIVYITNGTSGGSPQGVGGSAIPSMLYTSPERMYNYSLMTIEGKNLLFEVFDKEGQKIDFFEIEK